MFVTDIMINRKPGGNGARGDRAETLDEVAKIIGVLEGTDGWAQLAGPGKFMMINGSNGAFRVAVTHQEQPPRRFIVAKLAIAKVIEAAKAFADDGRLHAELTWTPEAVRQPGKPPRAPAGSASQQPTTRKRAG